MDLLFIKFTDLDIGINLLFTICLYECCKIHYIQKFEGMISKINDDFFR